MFYVYILQSGSNIYIGYTADLKRRVAEHNAGKNLSTKAYAPWKLIYYEAHTNNEDATRREKYFKHSSVRQALRQMLRYYYQTESSFSDQRSTAGETA